MTFKVTYNYKPHTWEDGKYIDNDTYTISIKDLDLEVTEDELDELWLAIRQAVKQRDDVRGYHE